MRIEITYEWDFETVDVHGDIQDHNFADRLADYSANEEGRLALVRNEGNENVGLDERYWAYVVDGKLPDYFENSLGTRIDIKVPMKYKVELAKYLNNKNAQ